MLPPTPPVLLLLFELFVVVDELFVEFPSVEFEVEPPVFEEFVSLLFVVEVEVFVEEFELFDEKLPVLLL